uniref:Apple domain-containing protein n=1 Tax=Steinernema glaseri TaxID=37863 RepID=A0A1I7ZNF4_9BILA
MCDVLSGPKQIPSRLISSNVDESQRDSAIYQRYDDVHIDIGSAPPNKKSLYDNVLLRLKLGRYAEHICDADQFRPYVKELGVMSFTCTEMCYKCFPGSFAVCYLKNRMFPGVAQTCLCSYDHEQPINRAAFSLKQGGVIMPNLLRFH